MNLALMSQKDYPVSLMAAAALHRIIDYPLDRVNLIHGCGSVQLVHFVPHQSAPTKGKAFDSTYDLDPVAPVIVTRLGNKFDEAMAKYYWLLMRWSKGYDENANIRWSKMMNKLIGEILGLASIMKARGIGRLSCEEWEYFSYCVEACAAFPGTGHKLVEEGW